MVNNLPSLNRAFCCNKQSFLIGYQPFHIHPIFQIHPVLVRPPRLRSRPALIARILASPNPSRPNLTHRTRTRTRAPPRAPHSCEICQPRALAPR